MSASMRCPKFALRPIAPGLSTQRRSQLTQGADETGKVNRSSRQYPRAAQLRTVSARRCRCRAHSVERREPAPPVRGHSECTQRRAVHSWRCFRRIRRTDSLTGVVPGGELRNGAPSTPCRTHRLQGPCMAVSGVRRARANHRRKRRLAREVHDLTDEQWIAVKAAWVACAYCGRDGRATPARLRSTHLPGRAIHVDQRRACLRFLQREQVQRRGHQPAATQAPRRARLPPAVPPHSIRARAQFTGRF